MEESTPATDDGYFYCLDANDGSLIWKWRDGSDEYPNAPIRHSAAYKDGVLYFGSDNSRAYAIRDDGGSASLVWKSDLLPGVGFSTYWPVVYTEPASGKVYVLFSGTKKEVGWVWFGDSYYQENYDIFSGIPTGQLVGPTGSEPGDWVAGTRTIDASKIQQYLQQKPHKRHLFVLDAATGVEHPSLAPVSWVATTHGGSKQPPVIGSDGVLYTHMGYKNGDPGLEPNAGASGGIAGWKFGAQFISQVYDFVRGYADEPVSFTGGGDLIYWVEGFNMGYGAFAIDEPYGSNDSWEYSSCGGIWGCLGIPGYDERYAPCELFGSCNGVYSAGVGGFYPYKGRVYLLERNALIAFSPSGGATRLPTIGVSAQTVADSSELSLDSLLGRLEVEVTRMLAAGHLRPGFHDSGLWGQSANGAYPPDVQGDHLAEYFHNPGDTVTTLLATLPYLSPSTQMQVKSYVQENYGPGAAYDFTKIAHVGWKEGAQREIYEDTPERAALMSRDYDDPLANIATVPRDYSQWNTSLEAWKFPQTSFYAAWKYAEVFPDQATTVLNAIGPKLEPTSSNPKFPTDAEFEQYPYILNAYIAAYRGYVELEKLAGTVSDVSQSAKWAEYNRLLELRVDSFSKDSYIRDESFTYEKTMNVARNFMYLTPELADELQSRVGADVQAAVTEYTDVEPYWFVSKFDVTYGEGAYQPLYDANALFQAKAYVLDEPFAQLAKYIDAPAFYRGDLFYLQNLVALLSAAGDGPIPETRAPIITSTPVTLVETGETYIYDVDATGVPTPTYALDQGPDGMTIDATTGVIRWAPNENNGVSSRSSRPTGNGPFVAPPYARWSGGAFWGLVSNGRPLASSASDRSPSAGDADLADPIPVVVRAANGIEPDAIQAFSLRVNLPQLDNSVYFPAVVR